MFSSGVQPGLEGSRLNGLLGDFDITKGNQSGQNNPDKLGMIEEVECFRSCTGSSEF
jgi:hypothetical protein